MAEDAGKPSGSILPSGKSVDAFNQETLKAVSKATKVSNSLPSEKKADVDYYNSFGGFRTVMESCSSRVESIMAAICKQNGIKSGTKLSGKSPQEMLDFLQDFNDQMLEKANLNLDEAAGIKNQDSAKLLVEVSKSGLARISGSWNKNMGGEKQKSGGESEQVKLLAAKHVSRPQLQFKDLVNNSNSCFVPRLTDKPHNKKPLSILIEYLEDGTEFYSHPYLFEIEHLTLPSWQLEEEKTSRPSVTSLEEGRPLVFVNTKSGLDDLVSDLADEPVIGVDVEHHSYRSYLGISCLVQLSSSQRDYVIDPFPLWSEMTSLNAVLANPKCLKIMHGCAVSDVKWLQRDFSLYFVNVFDSYIAAKTLGFPRGCLSLSYLLSKYCNVNLQKKFQLADWRIRPLSEDMLEYAVGDTRNLIDLYHKMKDELVSAGNSNLNLLRAVYDGSNDLCKFRYEKPFHDHATSYLHSLSRSRANLNSRQVYAYREIYNWRDKIGRLEDESIAYVLPPHMLLKICTELPRELQGILACCNPVPPLVKQHLHQLHDIILKARDQPLVAVPPTAATAAGNSAADSNGTNSNSTAANEFSQNAERQNAEGGHYGMESQLTCPLDLSHFGGEQNHQLETILGSQSDLETTSKRPAIIEVKVKPSIDVFFKAKKNGQTLSTSDVSNSHQKKSEDFLSPFQRFKLLQPFLESLKSAENGEDSKQNKTDSDRIQSIKEHFDALTAMTPEEYAGEASKADDKKEKEEEEEEEEEYVQPLDAYDPDPGIVQKLREFKNASSSNSNKRKMDGGREHGGKKPAFFAQADFSQYSGGSSGKKGGGENPNEFNPMRDLQNSNKGSKNSGRAKQRYKTGGKTAHFNKKR